jgi:hypothetical protein
VFVRVFICLLGVPAILLTSQAANAKGATCPLANITSASQLHHVLSVRAVEVLKFASVATADADSHLLALVAPSATFSIGAGDVIQRLGSGAEGARALAGAIHADSYRYLGWDYMDMPVDGCSLQKVSAEFVDSGSKTVAKVDFTFESGLLVKADAWSDTFESGAMTGANPR